MTFVTGLSADYVITPTFHRGNGFAHALINGWEFSGKVYWHTGVPYSIVDGNISGAVGNGLGNFLGTILPGQPAVQTGSCGKGAIDAPCLNAGAFYDTADNLLTAFPNQTRNQYHGAGYFDMDMGLFKTSSSRSPHTWPLGSWRSTRSITQTCLSRITTSAPGIQPSERSFPDLR